MASPQFDQVWEMVMNLSPNEWRRIRRLVDTLLTNGRPGTPEERTDFDLLKAGVISRIPPPIRDATSFDHFQPVAITGKPLSETIIEERR